MTAPSSSTRTTRSLTRRYLASLGAVAFMAIGGQYLIQKQLARQESDLKIIRIAQERQTICQRLLKEILGVALSPNPSPSAEERQTIMDQMKQRKDLRGALRDNMMAMVSSEEMPELDRLFVQLEPASKEILGTAQSVLDQPSNTTVSETMRDRLQNRVRTPKMITAEREFSSITDEMIQWYSQKVKTNLSQLKTLETMLLGGTLLLLTLEGLLIFRPTVKRLRSSLHSLSEALSQVQIEQGKSEKLLLNILPSPIVDRLRISSEAIADGFAEATVLFANIVGFTELSSRLSPKELQGYFILDSR